MKLIYYAAIIVILSIAEGQTKWILHEGDARGFGLDIAYANTEYSGNHPEIQISTGGSPEQYFEWIFLINSTDWIEANFITTKINSIGIQFWGDQNDGWASVFLNGILIWNNNTHGKDDKWPGGAFVRYLEIPDLQPGSHTLRVKNNGAGHVTIYLFGLGNVRMDQKPIPEANAINISTDNSGKIIFAKDIINKIKRNEPVNYDHKIIKGDLSIDQCDLPEMKNQTIHNKIFNLTIVKTPIKITNSQIDGSLRFSESIFLQDIDFSGSQFNGSSIFSNSKFYNNVGFNYSQFNGRAEFSRDQFMDACSFEGAKFNGANAYFRLAYFSNESNFLNTIFLADPNFSECNFSRGAYFKNTQFLGTNIDFRSAYFGQYADFFNATFKGNALFGNAFFPVTIFKKAKFYGKADFYGYRWGLYYSFKNYTDFRESLFNGDADFRKRRFTDAVTFENSHFKKNADFTRASFIRHSDFSNVIFGGNACFFGSNFNRTAIFLNSVFNNTISFQNSVFEVGADFSNSSFKEAVFDDADFRGIAIFNNSLFIKDALFRNTNFEDKLYFTRAKYETLYLRWSSIKKELAYDETTYQLLIENFKKLNFINDADICYYLSRDKNRPTLPLYYQPFDWMLKATYGYGTKPDRPFYWAFAVVLIFGFIFYITDSIQNSNNQKISVSDAILFSLTVFISGARGIGALVPDPADIKVTGDFRYLILIERLIGLILFALFLSALARTVIR